MPRAAVDRYRSSERYRSWPRMTDSTARRPESHGRTRGGDAGRTRQLRRLGIGPGRIAKAGAGVPGDELAQEKCHDRCPTSAATSEC
jgi:hypothetical protein